MPFTLLWTDDFRTQIVGSTQGTSRQNCTGIDACNSGTVLDLKYVCRINNNNNLTFEDHSNSHLNPISADIIKISGCRDEQTSTEDYINGQYKGVLTTYFLECVNELNYNCNSKQIIKLLKNKVIGLKYTQIPTLTCSNKDILSFKVLGPTPAPIPTPVPIPTPAPIPTSIPTPAPPFQPRRRKKFRLCSIL